MRPFLKWAGGKYRLVPRIRARLPAGDRLVEPFVGSAAVWCNTEYPAALLADANADLIGCYRQLQRHGEAFIAACRGYFVPEHNTPERYYAVRERFNATRDPWERAVETFRSSATVGANAGAGSYLPLNPAVRGAMRGGTGVVRWRSHRRRWRNSSTLKPAARINLRKRPRSRTE